MSDAQIQTAEGWTILHFPTVMGGVVPIYNLEGVTDKINFTQRAISGIFLGKITTWKRSRNPEFEPGHQTARRRRLSSCTALTDRARLFCWTDFLSKISPEWKHKVGKGTVCQLAYGSRRQRQ